ncbi:isochorismate synthase MenF [Conexibacter sp. DBS9H8]|uniref:isochorismate synthase n=1 Tax=Conexibacter sp. DBS9H8 TaxID=2937801 RepID=UPI00200FC692|nr:isochorismate synthase [Conexibacter sp. DBS9H8]
MSATSTREARPWLSAAARERLERRIRAAAQRQRRARTQEPVLVSVSERLSGPIDPLALVTGSRRADDDWFVLEQPARDGQVLATLGRAVACEAEGTTRFADVAGRWRRLVAGALADDLSGAGAPAAAGLVAAGGFAFADRVEAPEWSGFASASMIVGEVAVARAGREAWLTLTAAVGPGEAAESVLGRIDRRLAELAVGPVPLLDPAPTGVYRVRSAMPPAHHEEAVARAVQRIRAGELTKVVLAREVRVTAPVAHDPAAILGVLREGFGDCFIYAAGRGPATFLGATPELLVRREGQRAATVALAGSMRRSADPAVDDHLAEQLRSSAKNREENAIVARRIAAALAPRSVWVTVAPEPVVIRVANIQHLATPIRAQLAAPVDAVTLAGLLHPTPAVGGEPLTVARRLIPALEGFDRGWYAGALGWIDAADDGEFCVGLRCALLRGREASCYAGGGIVADSDPVAELAETEVKLQALLPVLAG